MKQTKRLTSQLELQYGNNHMGLAQQVGYLTGVLKAIEEAVEGTGKFIEEHTDYLMQSEKGFFFFKVRAHATVAEARALTLGGVAAQCFMASSKRNR